MKRKGRLITMQRYMAETLSENQRQQVQELVKGMLYSLHESEKYLSDYLENRVNAAKVFTIVSQTAHYTQEKMETILRMYRK